MSLKNVHRCIYTIQSSRNPLMKTVKTNLYIYIHIFIFFKYIIYIKWINVDYLGGKLPSGLICRGLKSRGGDTWTENRGASRFFDLRTQENCALCALSTFAFYSVLSASLNESRLFHENVSLYGRLAFINICTRIVRKSNSNLVNLMSVFNFIWMTKNICTQLF